MHARIWDCRAGSIPARLEHVSRLPLVCSLAAAAVLGGCVTAPAPKSLPPGPSPLAVASDQPFLAVDEAARNSVTCAALAERILADGRLEVLASLRNAAGRDFPAEVQCLFKDGQGALIGEATPWQKLALADRATETVRFISKGGAARRFTIAVRQGAHQN